jgi:hypothetical protein
VGSVYYTGYHLQGTRKVSLETRTISMGELVVSAAKCPNYTTAEGGVLTATRWFGGSTSEHEKFTVEVCYFFVSSLSFFHCSILC